MTTYTYTVNLSDGELIALQEALQRYAEICRQELKDGPRAPYWAHLRSIEAIERRLFEHAEMTSTTYYPDDANQPPTIVITVPPEKQGD